MISSEMIAKLKGYKYLVDLAVEDKAEGNDFGASALIRRYEELVEEELSYWHVDWAYAYSLGLVEDTTGCY